MGVPIADPLIPVYSNVTGYQHSHSTELTELFCQQLQMSVSSFQIIKVYKTSTQNLIVINISMSSMASVHN